MSTSNLEEDQEVAENLLNRIFYEEVTQDNIINILRLSSKLPLLLVRFLGLGLNL